MPKEDGSFTRAEIMQKLRTQQTSLTGTAADILAAVDESTLRNIIAIIISGDDTAARQVNLTFIGERTGAYLSNIPIAPTELLWLPINGYDIENPILSLEGGVRLQGLQDGGTGVEITIVFWDEREF